MQELQSGINPFGSSKFDPIDCVKLHPECSYIVQGKDRPRENTSVTVSSDCRTTQWWLVQHNFPSVQHMNKIAEWPLLTYIYWHVVHIPTHIPFESSPQRLIKCRLAEELVNPPALVDKEAGWIIIITLLCLSKWIITLALSVKPCPQSGQEGNMLQCWFLKQSGLISLGNYIGLFGLFSFFRTVQANFCYK